MPKNITRKALLIAPDLRLTGWGRAFGDPIKLPDGRELRTLHHAAEYIQELPAAMHKRPEWRTATLILIAAAEGKRPPILTRGSGPSSVRGEPIE